MAIPTLTLRYTFWLLQAKLRTDIQILFTFVLLIIHITLFQHPMYDPDQYCDYFRSESEYIEFRTQNIMRRLF